MHHRKTGSSHSTLDSSMPEKYLSILVSVSLNVVKIATVINSLLTCTSMRGMEGRTQRQETQVTIGMYDVLSNQVHSVDESMQHPFPSPPRATLVASTLDSETLPAALVLTFNAFKSTTDFTHKGLSDLSPIQRLLYPLKTQQLLLDWSPSVLLILSQLQVSSLCVTQMGHVLAILPVNVV